MSEAEVEQSAQEFREWHEKRGGEPYRAFKLWAASKAFHLIDQRRIWEAVCGRTP